MSQETMPAVALGGSVSIRDTISDMKSKVQVIAHIMKDIMKPDVHYGKVPGSKKPSLYKPGAEKICVAFHVADRYRVESIGTGDVVRYRVYCEGVHQGTGVILGEGVGECSSDEEKYKWRRAVCQEEWDNTDPKSRRTKYSSGSDDRGPNKTLQVATSPADVANTVLKMACKRAKIAMTLNVTAASDFFTQDAEDLPEGLEKYDDGQGAGTVKKKVVGGDGGETANLDDVLKKIAGINNKASQVEARALAEKIADPVQREAAREAYAAKVEELRNAAAARQRHPTEVRGDPGPDENMSGPAAAENNAEQAPSNDEPPVFTYSEVFKAISAAGIKSDMEALDLAGSMIKHVKSEGHRNELHKTFNMWREKLRKIDDLDVGGQA